MEESTGGYHIDLPMMYHPIGLRSDESALFNLIPFVISRASLGSGLLQMVLYFME
jgi:hypothetical protein